MKPKTNLIQINTYICIITMRNSIGLLKLIIVLFLMTKPLLASFPHEIIMENERIYHVHLLSNPRKEKQLTLFVSPAWYERKSETDSKPHSSPRNDHYVQVFSISEDKPTTSPSKEITLFDNFILKSFSYTHCVPTGFYKNYILFADSDIIGITKWRGRSGLNPFDAFEISKVPLDEKENKKYIGHISNDRLIKSPLWEPIVIPQEALTEMNKILPKPQGISFPNSVFVLTSMYDDVAEKGYCVGLSRSEEYDGVRYWPSATLWISAFSSPEFQVSPVLPESGNRIKDRFTHIAAAFFNAVPLIVYRNDRDGSVHVIDYDPKLLLNNSPTRQVLLPREFQAREVETLLLTSGKETAYLGVVFAGKKTDESKTLFLFCRTHESTDWNEYHRFELPNDSSSPTMCIQGGNLFYAYLQPTATENSSEVTDKPGKTSTDKKVVLFKHPLNFTSTHSPKP